jgi:hypothetical protein
MPRWSVDIIRKRAEYLGEVGAKERGRGKDELPNASGVRDEHPYLGGDQEPEPD